MITTSYEIGTLPFDASLWWRDDEGLDLDGKRHIHILQHVRALDEAQFHSRELDLHHGHAYDATCSLMGTEFELRKAPNQDGPIENVVRGGIDTMAAHLTRDRPRLAVLTDGQDFEVQEYAKAVEKVLAAEFRRLNIHRHRYLQCRDAGVFGSGLTKLYELNDRPQIDRVLKDEIVVDEEEGRYYSPRSIYQRRFVDRWVLIHRYARGRRKKEIEEAILRANVNGKWCSYRKMGRHEVALIEGWHLRSGEGATDGRHVICIEGMDLVDEPWTRDYFPFLKWDWSEGLTRFWGSGIAEQGLPVQERMNRHDRFIAVAQDRVAIPRVYFQRGSGVDVELDNRVGAKVAYTGRPPVFETPQAVSSEIYADRREKRNTFYEALGISQLMARASRPPGVDTQPAMREYRDQATERYAPQDQSLDDLLVEYGERLLDIIEEIAERTGTYKTMYLSTDTREEIDWSEVRLARDQYSIVVTTANGLSQTVAGLRQDVEEEYANGIIDKDEYRKLRGLPDKNAELALEGAVTSLSDAIISGLIRNKSFEQIAPDPLDDLQFIARRVRLKRADLKAHRAPPAMLERFDTWLEQASYLQEQAATALAAANPNPTQPGQALQGAPPGPTMVTNAPPTAQAPPNGQPPGQPPGQAPIMQ